MTDELVKIEQLPTLGDIKELQNVISKMPQVEVNTEHIFSDGMYCRKVFRYAGTLIVGKVHKKDHLFICAMGEIIVWSENNKTILKAGDVISSKAGTKRVTYATQDSIGITVHKTDNINLDDIEEELIETDETSLFDSANKLKQPLIENDKNIKELL